MIDHNGNDNRYASHGVGTAGLTTGIIGTAGFALNALQNGGLGGLIGNNPQMAALQQQVLALTADKAKLESEKYTDAQIANLYSAQVKDNKELTAFLFNIDKRVTAVETAAPLREQILRGEIAQVAQADLTTIQQHLAHTIDSQVENGTDVRTRIDTTVGSNVAGKLLDSHHIRILSHCKRMLHLGLHQRLIRATGCFTFSLSRLDASLGLIDFKKIGIYATHSNRIINHNSTFLG